MVLLHWEYIVFLPQLKCFKWSETFFLCIYLFAVILLTMVKRKKLSPVTVMMKNINIYLYEHKQSLELKHLSCCSVELRTWKLVNTHHGYPPASNQNETKGKCVCPREELWGFIWAASLRCHHIYRAAAFFSFFFFLSHQEWTNQWREIYSWMRRTSAVVGARRRWLIPPH